MSSVEIVDADGVRVDRRRRPPEPFLTFGGHGRGRGVDAVRAARQREDAEFVRLVGSEENRTALAQFFG